ncbi:hypothetical protein AB9M75_02375 [Lactobacillus sp. AN1001]
MGKRKRRYFYVRVEFLNGKQKEYMLPRDLQGAMATYFFENLDNWQDLLDGALINVPTKPYKNNKATIRTAVVKAQFIRRRSNRSRSRGQFIVRNSWNNVGLRKIILARRYLRHDFSLKNRFFISLNTFIWWIKSKFKLLK